VTARSPTAGHERGAGAQLFRSRRPLAAGRSERKRTLNAVATRAPPRWRTGRRRERVEANDVWLAASDGVPKLLLAFEPGPGTIITEPVINWCRDNFAGLEIERCGPAGHHAPEDQPDAIAAAIVAWATRHGLVGGPAADTARRTRGDGP
jgi:pimeloyl-ACP methyl ester carboxylesterase